MIRTGGPKKYLSLHGRIDLKVVMWMHRLWDCLFISVGRDPHFKTTCSRLRNAPTNLYTDIESKKITRVCLFSRFLCSVSQILQNQRFLTLETVLCKCQSINFLYDSESCKFLQSYRSFVIQSLNMNVTVCVLTEIFRNYSNF